MLKKLGFVLLLAVLLSQFTFLSVRAEGGCPEGFMRHEAMHHDDHPEHQHVGTSADQNGNGFICVKHITPDGSIHVHIDDNLPVDG